MHKRPTPVLRVVLLGTLVGAAPFSSACKRAERPAAPVAETQATTSQTTNQPVTVSGCLRAGDAADTYVLTASQTAQGATPATYQLVAANGGETLRDQVGKQVEVTGTVRAEQRTQTVAAAPAENKATGTSGTPAVETRTDLDIKRLDVTSVKPLDGRCEK